MSEQRKAVIKNADMSEDMQQDAVDIASQALAKYNIEKVRRNWEIENREEKLNVTKCKWMRDAKGLLIYGCNVHVGEIWDGTAVQIMGTPLFPISQNYLSYSFFFFYTKRLQDVAAYIKKEFDKKHNPTW